ncbi:MAG TPA: polymer-forming cytoskeletal protein [bacterium]|nr:polymer-forming cytoskeletal protein [bacterium]
MFGKNQNMENDGTGVDTIVGPSVSVEGNFKGDGNIIVEGEVRGSLKTKGYLKASESSVIVANIVAADADIAGQLTGNIKVKNSLDIKATAVIQGDIEAMIINVAGGAIINGNLKMKSGTEEKNSNQTTVEEN